MNVSKLKTSWNTSEKDIQFTCKSITSFFGKINTMDHEELGHFRQKLGLPEIDDENIKKSLREIVYNTHLVDLGASASRYEDITPEEGTNGSKDSGISANGRTVTYPESYFDSYSSSGSYEAVASGSNFTEVTVGISDPPYGNDSTAKKMSRHSSFVSGHDNDEMKENAPRPLSFSALSVHDNDRKSEIWYHSSHDSVPGGNDKKIMTSPNLPPRPPSREYERKEVPPSHSVPGGNDSKTMTSHSQLPPLPGRNERRNSKGMNQRK